MNEEVEQSDETDQSHTVTIEFDRVGYSPTLRFECHAPAGADCRTMCPLPECEEGCREDAAVHPRVPLDYCNNVEWFENGDDVETWIAGGETAVTLPVEVSWQGGTDGPEWRFTSTGPRLSVEWRAREHRTYGSRAEVERHYPDQQPITWRIRAESHVVGNWQPVNPPEQPGGAS